MARKQISLSQAALVVVLFAMLVFAVVWATMAWTSEDVTMSIHGWIALALGTIFSLLIGCGLMALMFYSSRSGYDDVATPVVLKDEDSRDLPR
jgi:TRAP-type C4-dicarboxylate transport system permease small subunit